MNPTRTVRLAALLLSGCLGTAGLAAAQTPASPAPPDAPAAPAAPTTPAAPIERQAPTPPSAPRAPRPMVPHFPMAVRDRDIHVEIHGPMGSGFHIVPPGLWWRDANVAQRLSLTPEQTKKMDDIFQQSRLQLIDLKANIERQNAILDPMLNANPIDQSRTLAQIDKVAQARAELEKADAKMLLGIRGVLTPDQWTKLQTRGERGDRGDRERGPGPGGMTGQRGDSGPAPRAQGGPGGPGELVAPQPQPEP